MPRDPRAYLWDVQQAGLAILAFTADLDLDRYLQHEMAQASVERKFEVIGEALNQLAKVAPDMASLIPELPRIVAFRNLLIHGYASVDAATVWHTVQHALPGLLDRVQRLLDADEGQARI